MRREMIADIVADLREWADNHAAIGPSALRDIADRIKAAAERLREDVIAETVKAAAISAVEVYEPHIHDDNPSNVAAMREALVLCYRVIHCVMVAGVINCDDANKAMDAYHAALAKPPRNCDLPEVAEWQPTGMAKQAWRVFKRSHKDSHLDAYGLLRCIGWLLAPAKKGGVM